MSQIRIRRREPAGEGPAKKNLEQTLRRQMAWAAGTEQFQHRDPLYHVTESFQQTFDAMGRRHAAQLAGGETEEHAGAQPGQPQEEAGQMPDPTSARGFYERSSPDNQDMLRRFSETAFQRGTLSGAVLRGTGKMMLFSCLKKTVGQSQPDKWQQRKLFEKASPMRNVPGHSPDKVVFNRGFTDSAVGLVVDALRGARRTVEDMRDLALGDDVLVEGELSNDYSIEEPEDDGFGSEEPDDDLFGSDADEDDLFGASSLEDLDGDL